MNLKEFRKKMNLARDLVARKDGGFGRYVCHALYGDFACFHKNHLKNGTIGDVFAEMFRPENKFPSEAFLSDAHAASNKNRHLFKMSAIERRVLFIDAFQGYCESEKLYKKWDDSGCPIVRKS